MSIATAVHNVTIVTADVAIKATDCIIYAVLLSPAAAASSIEFSNDANGAGASVIKVTAAAAGESVYHDFTDIGGVYFSSKCYADITGTSAQATVWWD
jgi:hypothetical protein